LRDENGNGAVESDRVRRGRPRRWSSEAEKHRQHRARESERTALVAELLHAVRNAHWEDAELERAINHGEDQEVLRALIAYCRSRNWMLWQSQANEGSRREE
jgi:hypothetical protein